MFDNTLSSFATIGIIMAVMAVIALIETAIPLHPRNRWNGAHLAPNLALTFTTFAANFVLNVGIVVGLLWLQSQGLGLLNIVSLPPVWAALIVVAALDFAFYVAHVAMHKVPAFWRFHRVHHSDPTVDVTTTVRQHPVEGVIRYAFIALFAFPLGAGVGGFALYRIWSAVNGLLEHANIRVPSWLDGLLSLVTTWPNMHKVHHSREPHLTDTNYSNIFSIWDRLFLTFTPSSRGATIAYGLAGEDSPARQSLGTLLAGPFQNGHPQPPRDTPRSATSP